MNQSYKKILAYLFGLTTLSSTSLVAWEYGWVGLAMDYVWQDEAPKLAIEKSNSIEDLEWEEAPPSREEEEAEELRTSKMEETYYERVEQQPPSEPRIGCICMDSERQDSRGAGACSGHGGVRFWLYQEPNGEIVELATKRHKDHPSKLTAKELSTLSHYQQNKLEYKAKGEDSSTSPYLVALMLICITAAYIASLKWRGQSE